MTLEPTWLTTMFAEAGLPPDQAERAGAAALRRLLRRQRKAPEPRGDSRFRSALTADPLVSVNRILGLGDGGLPFYDERLARVSEVDVTSVLTEIGLDASVALGFAKVVIEASDPSDWFGPLWTALGRTEPLSLDVLRQLDWSVLRSDPDRGLPPLDPGPPPAPGRRGPRRTEVDLAQVQSPLVRGTKAKDPPSRKRRAPPVAGE